MARKRRIKAWLVTWEWTGQANEMADKVVAILRPRLSAERVAELVETLHAVLTSTMREQATYAKGRSHVAYQAEIHPFGQISCGHNPWLSARPVSQLLVERDQHSELETLSWTEPDVFRVQDRSAIRVRAGDSVVYPRRVAGSYFHYAIWDRRASRYKVGWAPNAVPQRTDE